MNVAVGQIGLPIDIEPTTLPNMAHIIPAGRWKKVPGRFKSERYKVCSVVKDVAVGQIGCARDTKAAALPNKQTCNVPAGRWKKVQGRFKNRAPTICAQARKHCQNVTFQRGAGRKFQEGSKCERPRAAHRQGTSLCSQPRP